MRFLFLAPLPSAFGEALHGARLASAMIARGHAVHFAAPSTVATTVPDRVPFIAIDEALPRLDAEVEALIARLGIDALVLVDAAAVDKVTRAFRLSAARIANAAPVVSIDCWNLVSPPAAWDYGPVSEPLDPWLLENTAVIRPVPIARVDAPGAYAALPAAAIPSSEERSDIRRRFGLPDRPLIVWPTARWQLPDSHDNPALAQIAARLPGLVVPVLASLGDVTIAHVSPAPFGDFAGYHHVEPLPAAEFEALVGAADALLGFNAAATSLATALGLGVPTALCSPERIHAWPLRLDGVLGPTIRDNPFYETMLAIESVDELAAGLRALVFDADVRDAYRARQASYREAIAHLPEGPDRLLAALRG